MSKSTKTGALAPLRGYDNWTIGEMQKKLGRRSPDELEALLAYEKSTLARRGALDTIARALDNASDGPSRGASSRRSGSRKSSAKTTSSRKKTGASSSSSTSTKSPKAGSGKSGSRKSGLKKPLQLTDVHALMDDDSDEVAAPSRFAPVSELVGKIERRVLEAFGFGSRGKFDRQALMDRLSEFLEHERGGAKLYELGLEKVTHEEQRDRIQEFLDQTHRHEEILRGMILELGGHPDELSPSAELERQKGEALLEADAEGEVGLLNFFQNLFMAELTCHMNWEFLASCLRHIDDDEVRSALEPHVSQIEDEEDEHVSWSKKQLQECSLKNIFRDQDDALVSFGESSDDDEHVLGAVASDPEADDDDEEDLPELPED